MRFVIVLATLAFVPGSFARAQTAEIQEKIDKALAEKRKEAKLEDLLQQALKHNPDIRLGEARIREAEAQLNKVRLEVLQKVVSAHQQIKMAEASLAEATARFERAKTLLDRKVIAQEEFQAAQFTLQKYKAELDLAKAALPTLIGEQPAELRGAGPDSKASAETIRRLYLDLLGRTPTKEELEGAGADRPAKIVDRLVLEAWLRSADAEKRPIAAEQAHKVRKFLATPFSGDFREATPRAVLELLGEKAKGLNLDVRYPFEDALTKLSFKEPVPIGAVLQWFEDNYPVRFVLRDYGIIVADRKEVPPGAVSVVDFGKHADKDVKSSPK